MTRKKGFTLAEVLITLAIVGVVAALTLPTLISKINDKVTENQTKVFKAKVLKGLNLTRTHGDLNSTYSSTYDFLVNGLGKYLKMAKVCQANEIRNCVPYDSILYTASDNKEDSVDVKDIDTTEELGKKEKDGYKDIASFVMGDGTIVIATYKLDCVVDDGELNKDIGENECFAGIYDLNGTRKPNKMGKDLLTFNGVTLNIYKGPAILKTINGVKLITNVAAPTPMTKAECEANKTKYGISECEVSKDYWAGAVKTCKDAGGRLPTEEELTKIAQEVYNEPSLTAGYRANLTLDSSKVPTPLSGLASEWRRLWSGQENSSYYASRRIFYFGATGTGNGDSYDYSGRGSSYPLAICVTD